MAEEKMEFVTISLSRKQVNMEPVHNEKNGKDYLRIIAPNGGTIFYPASGLKDDPRDESRVYFSRPKGTELTIRYGVRNEETGGWDNKNHVVTIEDLKEMYEEEVQSFIEQRQIEQENGTSAFINFLVPTAWGREFESRHDSKKYVSISVPVREEDNSRSYYSFILPVDRFKPSKHQDGMSYFGFPRMQKSNPDQDYMITLKKSILGEDGNFHEVQRKMSSAELKGYVDNAVKSMNFIGIEISQKLVHPFTATSSGKELVSVSVPIPTDDQQGTDFWQIVLPPDRIRESKKAGMVYLSLFRTNENGSDWTHGATLSVKNEKTGGYDQKKMDCTSEQIIGFFKNSREAYIRQQNSNRQAPISRRQGR